MKRHDTQHNIFQGEFETAVSLLLPLRYHLAAIGGSKAQQDVVHLTLLDAALRLPDQVHQVVQLCPHRVGDPRGHCSVLSAIIDANGALSEVCLWYKYSFYFSLVHDVRNA